MKLQMWNETYMKNTYLPGLKWRVVVIPPSDPNARNSQPPVDYNDYEAVKRYYHLPD